MTELGELLQENKIITLVGFENGYIQRKNKMTNKALELLAPYLEGNTTLRSLDLSGNDLINQKSFPTIIKILEQSNVENITLGRVVLGDRLILALKMNANKIKNGSTGILDCSGNSLQEVHISLLHEIITKYGGKISQLKFVFCFLVFSLSSCPS